MLRVRWRMSMNAKEKSVFKRPPRNVWVWKIVRGFGASQKWSELLWGEGIFPQIYLRGTRNETNCIPNGKGETKEKVKLDVRVVCSGPESSENKKRCHSPSIFFSSLFVFCFLFFLSEERKRRAGLPTYGGKREKERCPHLGKKERKQ